MPNHPRRTGPWYGGGGPGQLFTTGLARAWLLPPHRVRSVGRR